MALHHLAPPTGDACECGAIAERRVEAWAYDYQMLWLLVAQRTSSTATCVMAITPMMLSIDH
jgi:hypothetical protein